jgi:hypothetical protein
MTSGWGYIHQTVIGDLQAKAEPQKTPPGWGGV